MYRASVIEKLLSNNKSKLLGTHSYRRFSALLSNTFRKRDPYKIRTVRHDDYGPIDYAVSGMYDMSTDTKYLILHFSSECSEFALTEKIWKEFKFTVSQVCQHESIHQMQWKGRCYGESDVVVDYKSDYETDEEMREYLSDLDEIDAYGHDIAMEIKYFYPNKSPEMVLRDIDRYKKLWSYYYYKRYFKGVRWRKIRSKLLERVQAWLPTVT